MATTDGRWFGGYTVESTASGVQVEKGLDLETLALPAVKFRIESHRDARVGIVLEDCVPDSISVHDVGFHSDHGAENWHVYDGGRLRWVNTLPPGESTTTLYGVWLADTRDVYDIFDPVTIDMVRALPHGDHFAPRLDGREATKHSVDEALESERFETFDALRTEIAAALGHPGQQPDDRRDPDRPRPVGEGPPIERAGAVALDPPAPTAINALDDPTVTGERLFVRTLVRDGAVPQVAESVSTAGEVVGRRVREHRSGHELFEAVLATAHAPERLATRLAERDVVGGVLIAIVEKAMPDAPDQSRSMTEFSLLQREVDPVSPGQIEGELDTATDDDVAMADLVSLDDEWVPTDSVPEIGDRSTSEPTDRETVEALRTEVERLRHRVASLEAEVDRLQERDDDGDAPDRDATGTGDRDETEAAFRFTSR
jgi:hypothetical protein